MAARGGGTPDEVLPVEMRRLLPTSLALLGIGLGAILMGLGGWMARRRPAAAVAI